MRVDCNLSGFNCLALQNDVTCLILLPVIIFLILLLHHELPIIVVMQELSVERTMSNSSKIFITSRSTILFMDVLIEFKLPSIKTLDTN